ncbi:MAG: SAM hydrolase/SAM-dependent halogenase family protein [Actinomycetota bacterium]
MAQHSIVTFLSDYGLQDEFVGVCRGVMLGIKSDLRIIDIHHNILRQDVRHGAIVLQQSIKYMPDGVHLAVVDPAVGTERRAVAIETRHGNIFVAPDNGLVIPAVNESGGVRAAYLLANRSLMLSPMSATFHGRDVFAPAAAHIANGVELKEFGPELPSDELARLEVPIAWTHDDHLHAEVLQLDRFGNLQLNFDRRMLESVGMGDGKRVEIRMEGHRLQVPLGTSFADVEVGEFVLVEDSYEKLSLAVNKGDAAARLQAEAGSTIIVGPSVG